jgi:hypothetical protein
MEVEDLRLRDIFACLAGDIAPEDLVESAKSPEHLCEACYYAGEAERLRGDPVRARSWFQQCVNTGIQFDPGIVTPTPMNEYDLSEWRLATLYAPTRTPQPASSPSVPPPGDSPR